ncbi:MAG: hypothetical protein ABIC95_06320 [archaeon]
MPEHDPQAVKQEFSSGMRQLRDSVMQLNTLLEPMAEKNISSRNPLFEKKLEVHRSLLDLVRQQEELSEGIIALLQVIDEYATSRVRRPPMPPPPRPANNPFILGEGATQNFK